MPRSSKTSNVLKMLNLPVEEPAKAIKNKQKPKALYESELSFPSTNQEYNPNNFGFDGITTGGTPAAHRRRKAIVKHMKPLPEAGEENPALKAITFEDKVFIRASCERQIVSIPLMLVNEQIGAAVERFNACACDECLRGIINSALDLMPAMYVRVLNGADEEEVNRLIKNGRAEAIRVLAKVCIAANKTPFHNDKDENI
ncbi:MAG: hypothetical protein FWG44_04430 [Oscillospiraceae bacterium]|nr:hypothetical protein [Oscillospiraceae bacterium]